MAKTKISNTDLIWLFHEKLREFEDHPQNGLAVAIIPEGKGNWRALTPRKIQAHQRILIERIGEIEKQLREHYVLAAQ